MSMFNTGDILETIEMFTQDNLDVRTVTMGISLLDCIDPDPKKACENIYNKITTKAANLVPAVEHISAEYGIPIINMIQDVIQILGFQIAFHLFSCGFSLIYKFNSGFCINNHFQHCLYLAFRILEHGRYRRFHCVRILLQCVQIQIILIHQHVIYHIRTIKSDAGYLTNSSHIHGTLLVGQFSCQFEFGLLAASCQ